MAGAWEQFVGVMSNAGPLATGLAIAAVPFVAGLSAYITKMSLQAKIDGLDGDVRRLKDRLADLQAVKDAEVERLDEQYKALESRYRAMIATRAALQSQLDVITASVEDLALHLDAKDYSIMVPAPTLIPGDRPDELVFLCASGPQGAKLRSVRVPVETSMAGQVFLSGSATIASPKRNGASFSSQTDQVSDYRTDEALSVCLHYRGEACGVVQFLNRHNARFSGEDVENAVRLSRGLSMQVGEFVADPTRLTELGYSPRRNDFSATVLFADMSGYSKLFDVLDSSVINDMLNQYFEAIGDVAFAHNAVIDQFVGDGVLIVFGGAAQTADHQNNAIEAARKMRIAFAALRRRWQTIEYHGADQVFLRIGLAAGPITRTEIGHRQFRRVTVLGACVNHAALVCERAPRGVDTICLSRTLSQAVSARTELINEADCGLFELKD
ncbi:MAG: adenylate/guanylate cyclase domain-containing protein [Novosphingobium sp.]